MKNYGRLTAETRGVASFRGFISADNTEFIRMYAAATGVRETTLCNRLLNAYVELIRQPFTLLPAPVSISSLNDEAEAEVDAPLLSNSKIFPEL